MAEQIWNNPTTPATLAANMGSSDTFCFVTGAAGLYPYTGNFRIYVDTELMEVTGVSYGSCVGPMPLSLGPSVGAFQTGVPNGIAVFQIVRGTENTTAATHTSGANVLIMCSKAALSGLRYDVNQTGTFANRPTSGMQTGDHYKCTDIDYDFIYTGTVWQAYIGSIPVTVPPSAAGLFIINPASFSTSDNSHGTVYHQASGTSSGGYNVKGYYKPTATVPGTSAPYSNILGFRMWDTFDTGGQMYWGMFISNYSNIIFFGFGEDGPGYTVLSFNWTGGYSGFNPIANGSAASSLNQYKWLRFYDDGTNWNFYGSTNKQIWLTVYSGTRTNGYNWVGWGCCTQNSATSNQAMDVFDFSEGTS